MTIAFQPDITSSAESLNSDFNFMIFSEMAKLYPELDFIMITYNDIDPCFITEKNIQIHVLKPQPTNFLKKIMLFDYAIPQFFKKNKVDFFISGNHWCPKIAHSKKIANINSAAIFDKNKSLKHLSNADFIIVANDYLKTLTEIYFPSKQKDIVVVPGVVNKNIFPLDDIQLSEVKKEFSEERDYFLVLAENSLQEQIIDCLKAFSQFKKWQKSSMKILIVLNHKQKPAVDFAISNYKFRDDVIVISNKPEGVINALLASAYGVIFPDNKHQNRQKIFFAMQSKVPVIVPDEASERSSFEDAALFGSENEKVLSKNLMLIYKDEETRTALIKAGTNLTNSMHPEKIAKIIKESIIDAIQE